MTYQQKLRKVMDLLDDPEVTIGDDYNTEWAINILKSISITPENPNGIAPQPATTAEPTLHTEVSAAKNEMPNVVPFAQWWNEKSKSNTNYL